MHAPTLAEMLNKSRAENVAPKATECDGLGEKNADRSDLAAGVTSVEAWKPGHSSHLVAIFVSIHPPAARRRLCRCLSRLGARPQ